MKDVGGRGRDERVLGPRVELDQQHRAEPIERVEQYPVDGREDPEPERVLDPLARPGDRSMSARNRAAAATVPGCGLPCWTSAAYGSGDPARATKVSAATTSAAVGERHRGRVGQRGLGDRERAAAQQRQRVQAVDRERRWAGPDPGAFAQHGQGQLGEGGEIAGADRTDLVQRWVRPRVDRGDDRLDQRGLDAGAPGQQLIGPHHQQGPRGPGFDQFTGTAGVTAQQP